MPSNRTCLAPTPISAQLIHAIDPAARDLEGYVFPDTYALPRRTTAAQLMKLAVDRFEHVFTPELRRDAAAHQLTVRQAVTLASIVEKESARADERPQVASVYVNRLRIGMPMQCDPTVIYALSRAGKYTGNLHREDLSFDSPYNTYRYPGLPPGPIAAPGRGALEAAVHPATSDICIRHRATTAPTNSQERSTSTIATCRSIRWSTFRDQRAGRAGGAGGAGEAGRAGGGGRPGGPGI